ncbi:hypothetical protein VP01_953g1 [Puccinia sorghi]|uniref:Uncharacterized protein n=1 Tax=Puccinia sorghi TaxID=27349 RepID=A0A0L6U6A5_9BASI|nr:hypothetical protein VP01_953g1 [Puccinia sorghi]
MNTCIYHHHPIFLDLCILLFMHNMLLSNFPFLNALFGAIEAISLHPHSLKRTPLTIFFFCEPQNLIWEFSRVIFFFLPMLKENSKIIILEFSIKFSHHTPQLIYKQNLNILKIHFFFFQDQDLRQFKLNPDSKERTRTQENQRKTTWNPSIPMYNSSFCHLHPTLRIRNHKRMGLILKVLSVGDLLLLDGFRKPKEEGGEAKKKLISGGSKEVPKIVLKILAKVMDSEFLYVFWDTIKSQNLSVYGKYVFNGKYVWLWEICLAMGNLSGYGKSGEGSSSYSGRLMTPAELNSQATGCYDLVTPFRTCQEFPQLGDYLQPPHLCTIPKVVGFQAWQPTKSQTFCEIPVIHIEQYPKIYTTYTLHNPNTPAKDQLSKPSIRQYIKNDFELNKKSSTYFDSNFYFLYFILFCFEIKIKIPMRLRPPTNKTTATRMLNFKLAENSKRVTGLDQDGAEKEGEEPMIKLLLFKNIHNKSRRIEKNNSEQVQRLQGVPRQIIKGKGLRYEQEREEMIFSYAPCESRSHKIPFWVSIRLETDSGIESPKGTQRKSKIHHAPQLA